MLLVEYSILDRVKVINESKNGVTKLKILGKFQKCDEQNNNGRVYPRPILESQVKAIQDKIDERSLVGALDHPSNDAIHLSQASHLITKLWVEKNGDVMGEAEILSTPNGKIVEALINDGVKIGISSRGLGSVSEGTTGKVVNEDFKLITFDLVSDPSTKGAFPELSESINENSARAQAIVSKYKKQRVMLTMLESKIRNKVSEGSYEDPRDNMGWNGPKKVKRTLAGGGGGGTHSRMQDHTPSDNSPEGRKATLKKYRKISQDKAAKKAGGATGREDSSLTIKIAKRLKSVFESKMSDFDVQRQEKARKMRDLHRGMSKDASAEIERRRQLNVQRNQGPKGPKDKP